MTDQRKPDDEAREYEAPKLTVLASVEEATLGDPEGNTSDADGFSTVPS